MAHTLSPIPPDPERVAAANSMVSQMPLDEIFRRAVQDQKAIREICDSWLVANGSALPDRNAHRLFVLKVRDTAREEASRLADVIRPDIALHFAYQLNAPNLRENANFFSTKAGQSYLLATLGNDTIIAHFWSIAVKREIEPKFEQLLAEAEENAELLRRVNETQ
ncbi:hypothetical protein QWY75_03030 [Pontixanthobacter aestiaquae]|uniref:Uncharacterized protein n=1 Tax=Pontixanthobacter aestiaquae TaxID=1509367 RepID=A0A844Z939_9SPHN|nr:hypothetical protein [Pontixanthobacter aestiaquae]MDN3645178.1 hypothetical protein [Pontixanthobacter aestiaquae]MXO83822.1 hypothetical protein [Pontixanthobacter aestiaquae]